MKTKYAIFLLFMLYCINTSGQEVYDSLFVVKKIKSKGDYYYIDAVRNDSTFLILSKKEQLSKVEGLTKIKKGKSYYFDFNVADNEGIPDRIKPLDGIMNYLDVHFVIIDEKGTEVKRTEKYHYRVYSTKNLIDLYYIPSGKKIEE